MTGIFGLLADQAAQRQSIHHWHDQVEQDKIDFPGAEQGECGSTAMRDEHGKALGLQRETEDHPHLRFVLDYQNCGLPGHGGSFPGSLTRNVVPF